MQPIKYNTNYNISFKLTDNGEKCLDLHIDNTRNMSIGLRNYNINPDVDNKYTMQMWKAFQIFGNSHILGTVAPFDMCTIELDSKHIEHPEEIIDIVTNIISAKKHADNLEYPDYISKHTLETLAKYLNIDYNTVT